MVIIACSWIAGWETAGIWAFGWWALFDTFWGLLAVRNPFYIGETAWLDRLQRAYGIIQVLKYAGFIASLIIYFI